MEVLAAWREGRHQRRRERDLTYAQRSLLRTIASGRPALAALSAAEVLSTLARTLELLPPGAAPEHREPLGPLLLGLARSAPQPEVQHFVLGLGRRACDRELMENPDLDGGVLEALFDAPGAHREAVLAHPRLTAGLARRAASTAFDDASGNLRLVLAANPGTPGDVVEHLLSRVLSELSAAAHSMTPARRRLDEGRALEVLERLIAQDRLPSDAAGRLLDLGTHAADQAALRASTDPEVQLRLLERRSTDASFVSALCRLPSLGPDLLAALLVNPAAALVLPQRGDLPLAAQLDLASRHDVEVDAALAGSPATAPEVLEQVLKRCPPGGHAWASYSSRQAPPLPPQGWMPPWFLLAEFPLHLESLARDCGVDPGTLLELAPEWSGSLAELLDAAQELGPDVP